MNSKTIPKHLQVLSMTNMTISIAKSMIAFSFILTTQHATTVYETHVPSRVIYWWHGLGIIEQGKS